MTTKTDQKFKPHKNLEESKLVSHLVFPTWLAITIGTREGETVRGQKKVMILKQFYAALVLLLLLLRLSLVFVRVGVRASVRAKKGGIGSKSVGVPCAFVASRRTVQGPIYTSGQEPAQTGNGAILLIKSSQLGPIGFTLLSPIPRTQMSTYGLFTVTSQSKVVINWGYLVSYN
jgi:hypothetical protein